MSHPALPFAASAYNNVISLLSDDDEEADPSNGSGGNGHSASAELSEDEMLWGDYDSDNDAKPAAVVTPEKCATHDGCEKAFWSLPSDEATIIKGHSVQFTVRGKPCALRRPGPRQCASKSGGHRPFYNPSKGKQGVFKNIVLALLPPDKANKVMFPSKTPVSVKLVSFLQRPLSHFVGNQRDGKLRSGAPTYAIGRTDVDNIAKFVLDCLNGIVYQDDRQVVELYACKRYATPGEEATSITVTSLI